MYCTVLHKHYDAVHKEAQDQRLRAHGREPISQPTRARLRGGTGVGRRGQAESGFCVLVVRSHGAQPLQTPHT